jgi:hypothetical protein
MPVLVNRLRRFPADKAAIRWFNCFDRAIDVRYNARMARRKTKRNFSVQANMKVFELSKAGTSVDFDIFSQGEKFGTLIVGRGSVTWYGHNRKIGRRMSWARFDRLMQP